MTADPAPDPVAASLRRINALLAWWGLPKISSAAETEREIRRFQNFAADLQTLYGDAAGLQVRAILATNEEIARALCQLLQQRRPQDLLAAESRLVASVLEAAALHAKTWISASQQLNARCAAFAREATMDLDPPNGEASDSGPSVSPS